LITEHIGRDWPARDPEYTMVSDAAAAAPSSARTNSSRYRGTPADAAYTGRLERNAARPRVSSVAD
jgi:hypothetical protein